MAAAVVFLLFAFHHFSPAWASLFSARSSANLFPITVFFVSGSVTNCRAHLARSSWRENSRMSVTVDARRQRREGLVDSDGDVHLLELMRASRSERVDADTPSNASALVVTDLSATQKQEAAKEASDVALEAAQEALAAARMAHDKIVEITGSDLDPIKQLGANTNDQAHTPMQFGLEQKILVGGSLESTERTEVSNSQTPTTKPRVSKRKRKRPRPTTKVATTTLAPPDFGRTIGPPTPIGTPVEVVGIPSTHNRIGRFSTTTSTTEEVEVSTSLGIKSGVEGESTTPKPEAKKGGYSGNILLWVFVSLAIVVAVPLLNVVLVIIWRGYARGSNPEENENEESDAAEKRQKPLASAGAGEDRSSNISPSQMNRRMSCEPTQPPGARAA